MVFTLMVGLTILYSLRTRFDTMTQRKLFHFLAFALFLPPLSQLQHSRPITRLIIFAFNCVTPLLILLETLRKQFGVFDAYFKGFTTSRRELQSNIVTHIYLLAGIALPVQVSFIILDGGFFNSEFQLFAVSGLVFLSAGDTVACLYGRAFGLTKWRENHGKTAEGTFAGLIVMCICYFCICKILCERLMHSLAIFVFATFAVALLEALTV